MLIYLLKSGACLAIFMAFYTFFLEKENMHVFKRYYLLGALIMAFAIPLVTFTKYIEVAPLPTVDQSMEAIVYYSEETPKIQQANYLPFILWSIYVLGVLAFGSKFLINLVQLVLKIKRNPKKKSKNVIHVLLSDLVTPHTFFKYIFLNKRKFEKHEIPKEVFWHEETHAKQKHSIDVLFVELLQVIFWFNPLIYFTKRSIKMNHEFLADQAVLNKGISLPTYQHILLAFSSPDSYRDASEFPLANAINYPSTRHTAGVIKKRFTVMKTHTTKRKIWLKSLVLLPLLALTLYGFSEKKEVVKLSATQNLSLDTIQDILISIDANDAISLNGDPMKFEELETEINKLNPHLSKEQKRNFVWASIRYESDENLKLIKRIQPVLFKYGTSGIGTLNVNTLKKLNLQNKTYKNKYAGKTLEEANAIFDEETIDLSPPKPIDPNSPWQIGLEVNAISTEETDEESVTVTSEMLKEYNVIAKSINTQPEATRTAKLKDFNRLSEIYNYMSEEQKQVSEPFPSLPKYDIIENTQKKATRGEISEYNKLAIHYRSQSPEKMVIRMKDMRRIMELHDKMTPEQRASAEPMPNFPPPPPPPTKDGPRNSTLVNKTISPPPPPPPANASNKQKKAYEKAMEEYKIQRESYTYKHTNDKGEVVDIIVIPENDGIVPPPPPPTPLNINQSKINQNILPPPSQDRELVMVNGNKPVNNILTMSRAELTNAKLSINGGKIVSFKLKTPRKPTQSIEGNVMDAEAKKIINGAYDNDATQIFMIKDSDGIEYPPLTIMIKEIKTDLNRSNNVRQYILERDKTFKLLKKPSEYPGSFLEMSEGDQRLFQEQYLKMYQTFSKLTELEKNSAPKMLPPAPDPMLYTLKNGKIIKKNQ